MDVLQYLQYVAFKMYFLALYIAHDFFNFIFSWLMKLSNFFFGYWFKLGIPFTLIDLTEVCTIYIAIPFMDFFAPAFKMFGINANFHINNSFEASFIPRAHV